MVAFERIGWPIKHQHMYKSTKPASVFNVEECKCATNIVCYLWNNFPSSVSCLSSIVSSVIAVSVVGEQM